MNLAPIFRQALDLWGNPSYLELSPEAFLDAANRSISNFGLDLDLTPDAAFYSANSKVFTFASADAREKDLDGVFDDDISRVVRVESRGTSSTSEDDWVEERRASYDNWNDVLERSDGNFVAFYGLPPALTIVTNRDTTDTEFRVVYRTLRDKIITAEAELDLPSIYEPLLVYDIALEAGILIDNRSPEFAAVRNEKMAFLAIRRKEAFDRIEKWRRSAKGTSVTHRRAFNDRSGTFSPGHRKLTVRW